jgi:hypothetical protein
MKAIIDGKEVEMSVLQAATGFRATELTLNHKDLKTLAKMPDERIVAFVHQLAARVL